jgi:ribosome-associated translation inhibitor RaiA
MSTSPSDTDATVANSLILGHGFHEDERDRVVELLHQIDHRLHGVPEGDAQFEVLVKDRDGKEQKVTLEGRIHSAHLVATGTDEDVWVALAHVRDEFLRQYNEWRDQHRR